MDSISGLEREKSALLNAVFAGRFPQVLTLVSSEMERRLDLAWATAQMLVCEAESQPCGSCGPCLRVASKQSESALLIEPKGLTVKVEQVKDVLNFVSLRTLGRARVVILNEAENLGLQAGNALLKTLEEPDEKTYFILLAKSRESLLTTIRSRTQVLRLSSERTVDGTVEDRVLALNALIAMLESRSVVLPEAILEVKGNVESCLQWTFLWQQFLRDAIALNFHSEDLLHEDLKAEFVRLQGYGVGELLHYSRLVFQLEQDLKAHVDRTLAFEEMGLNIQEGRA